MKKARAAIALAAFILLAACGGGSEPKPAAINEDTDKCAACNMQVKDDGFATQLITEDKRVFKFDDIGCMFEWKSENSGTEIAIEFVRDHGTLEWVKAENAFYVYDPSFQTPMAYGVLSFRDRTAAEAYAAEHGTGVVMDWVQLENHTWERNKKETHGGMDGHGAGHDDSHAQKAHMEGHA
jgi:copper chaperone NosL